MQTRDQHVHLNDEEVALLEQVRQQQGLDDIDQAAEWLVKSRMRRQTKLFTGRGPAMYLVHGKRT